MVVFNDAFFDVFRFKFNSLFSSGDGVHQVRVIFVLGVVEVLGVLVDDVLLFSEEVIDFVLVAIGSIILLAWAGKELYNNPWEKVRSRINMIKNSVNSLIRQQTLIQTLIKEIVMQNDDFIDRFDLK